MFVLVWLVTVVVGCFGVFVVVVSFPTSKAWGLERKAQRLRTTAALTGFKFPAFTLDHSERPVTFALEDLAPSSGFCWHLHAQQLTE